MGLPGCEAMDYKQRPGDWIMPGGIREVAAR